MEDLTQQDGTALVDGTAFVAAALAAPVLEIVEVHPENPIPVLTNAVEVPAGAELVATPEGDRGPSTDMPEDPNVASTAASAPASETASSAGNASVDSGASPTGVSSVVSLPLESRIAPHLEAIYQLAKDDAARMPQTVTSAAGDLKTHASDILHKIRNGMSVAEGELVMKLEHLIGML